MRTFGFSVEINSVLDSLGDKQEDFVQAAVIEKAQREGLLKSPVQVTEAESKNPSVGNRLRQRERVFLDGPPNLSDRHTRKQIVNEAVDERDQARQSLA